MCCGEYAGAGLRGMVEGFWWMELGLEDGIGMTVVAVGGWGEG